ncbi:hypothetical protein [Mesorhizobium sp. RIZ17]|uniref:hypothetical protein n=1 Tax=Mesorhizobium sp. RIZ17 TaxID=3132743 RepID=UPI003DA8C86A
MLNTRPRPAALASANFGTGVYTVAGVPVLLADIIDQPELVLGGQLLIPEEGDVVAMLGGLLDVMLTANWTIVLQWYVNGGD